MRRRTMLSSVIAGALASVAATVRPTVAQTATPNALATHPIIGAWLVMNPGSPPNASPIIFAADGTMTAAYAPSYVDPKLGVVLQGPGIGVWEPTGPRSIHVLMVQALSAVDGTYLGTFTLDGYPEVNADGLGWTDDGTRVHFTIRDANNVVTQEVGGGAGAAPATPVVHATRIQVGNAGFPPATPTAGAPTG